MGAGWRRVFCTSIRRESEVEKQQNPSPKAYSKLGFFSNPSTPRMQSQPLVSPGLRCRTTVTDQDGGPLLLCKTGTPTTKSPKFLPGSASDPSSPKSPARFALFKSPRLRLSFRSRCGICLQSVKTGQGTAIFTAECSHAFHFPCIAAHVKKQGSLVCPVCSAAWREVPLLAIYKQHHEEEEEEEVEEQKAVESEKPQKARTDQIAPNPSKPIPDSRLYDDDEPLISPRFNAIPETDEDNEDGEQIGEFQGFFADPSSSSKPEGTNGGDFSRVVEAKLLPEAAVVSTGRSHESYVVAMSVKAPALRADPARRAPVDLVTVLDVSGSMTGAKLHMLKRAMRLVVASLGPADRLSIVAFSAGSKRLLPLKRMTPNGQRAARRIVDWLACGNGTCVGEALRKATKVLEDRRERNPVASVMLLSDGHDERVSQNTNNRRRSTSAASTRFAHLEIPVQSFGFAGAHSHDAFTKCVGGLLSVVVQDLRVRLGFSSGDISAVYSCIGRPVSLEPGSSSFRLGDLYAEEERVLLVELRVPTSAIGAHHAISVRFSYTDPATAEQVNCKEQALLVPRPHAMRSSDPKIQRLRNVFITTRAVAESRRMVELNDPSGAHNLLISARALLLNSSSISADENLRCLEAELAELHASHMYHQHQLRRNDHPLVDDNGEPLTPTSAWRAAEQLAKVAIMRKSMNMVRDLHGFENARF